ncbi:mismatch-specific DNA-glycosylase [Miniimonas arenae]|nr:mismatch-specific DNA-glycosylase [Miniimonas arenae]
MVDDIDGQEAVLGRPRRPSPMGGGRPVRADLAAFDGMPDGVDDVLPASGRVRLLIVGVNPGLWTAAVNAPFAFPGNRFWPSLHRAGLTERPVDAAAGLSADDEAQLLGRGIGITNLVGRATARADELTRDELRAGGARLVERLTRPGVSQSSDANAEHGAGPSVNPHPGLRPDAVAVAGITAFRTAFGLPKARLGRQDPALVPGWPPGVALWVVPQPSGLNAHATVDSLAGQWREVWSSLPPV